MKPHGIFQRILDRLLPQSPTICQLIRRQCLTSVNFKGNIENLIKNGETLLQERIILFDGKTNPICFFSVDDLNSMNVISNPVYLDGFSYNSYAGVWNNQSVLVKIYDERRPLIDEYSKLFGCRDIAIATQMSNHRFVHRPLGCCLETNYAVLVYEWPENGTLRDRIISYKGLNKKPLAWKDRLRIAWEIAYAVSYLHTAFRRTIVHRNLQPSTVFLDQDDSARLSDFSLCISIPEGKKYVEDMVIGTMGYYAPEYIRSGRLTESIDVFSFGELLLTLFTGKLTTRRLFDWVNSNCPGDIIVDPAITANRPVGDERTDRQLKEFVELALRCASDEEERRPTMVDVTTQLKNMIMLSSDDSL